MDARATHEVSMRPRPFVAPTLSDNVMLLLQLCAPCQMAIRGRLFHEIKGPDIQKRWRWGKTIYRYQWSCPLCTTIASLVPGGIWGLFRRLLVKDEHINYNSIPLLPRKSHDHWRSSLTDTIRLSVDELPQVGDIQDIILFCDPLQRSQQSFRHDLVGPSEIAQANRCPGKPILRLVPRRQIDTKLVSKWIRYCEECHPACRPTFGQDLHTHNLSLKLIDVGRKRLVNATATTPYFALSYVWGDVVQFALTEANLSSLQEDRGLQKYWDRLSPVLKDAMAFVEAIGGQFLWVDTLCIIQDHPQRSLDISKMDKIYKYAICTLVAVDGQASTSRLHGVFPYTRVITPYHETKNLILATRRSELAHIFATSTYEQRAWTFQERICSMRCLYFTTEQLYFHCREAVWSEDRYEHFKQSPDNFAIYPSLMWNVQISLKDCSGRFRAYTRLVQEYTRRELSLPADRLDAFDGIANNLGTEWEYDFVSGLPVPFLDCALLWISLETSQTRVRRDRTNEYLPSWSWAGWTNGVHYGLVTELPTFFAFKVFEITTSDGPESFSISRQNANRRLQAMPGVERGDGFQSKSSFSPEYQNILSFWTEAVPARNFSLITTRLPQLSKKIHHDLGSNTIRRILDMEHRACGLLIYGARLSSDLFSVSESESKFQYIQISDSPGKPYASILDDSFTNLDEDTDYLEVNCYDKVYEGYGATLNVLLIEWNDVGFAERVAVGQIHSGAWKSAKPVQKRINLG